jgi:hypothetical protein
MRILVLLTLATLTQATVFLSTDSRDIPRVASGPSKADVKDTETNEIEQVPVVGDAFSVHPVSTTMKCVISLTIQYLLVYTALALCRTAADSFNVKYDNLPIQKILVTATLTVNYAPMLAVLFLGFRMRVLQLTKGKGNPPEWVQLCMYFCTYAVLALTLSVTIIPLFTGEVINVDYKTGDIPHDHEPFDNQICAIFFTMVKYFIMLGLYVGVICIIYGIYSYVPPKGIWPEGKTFPVSPAVQCTTILTCQYFVLYALVAFSRTYTQFSKVKMTKFENAMLTATNAMNFAPMLSILFIGARMRALQMDPVNGNPQRWAQNCFYMCTYAVAAQVILSIIIPLVLQGEAKVGKTEGDMEYTVENKGLGSALTIARFAIMFCIYIGFSCVIWSVFTIQHPKGKEYTPPVSVTMQCVINLTVQFFFIYLVIWVGITLKEFTGLEWALLTQTMENAKATVQFCPMLAILFVGTRMRALQITDNRGAPQGWVQDGMYMATWSILLQFLMCMIVPICTGSPCQCDDDGHITWRPAHPIGFYIVETIRWLSFFLMYGGTITVIIGVYTMTPETANGRGSVPLVGDGRVGPNGEAAVPGYDGIKEPYGANDLPGVPGF